MRNPYSILDVKSKGKRPLGRLGHIDGRIILRWILRK
jgi:hypothetical protein